MPNHDIQSVGQMLEIIHEEVMDLHRKVRVMQIEIAKLTAAEAALIGVVEQVLVVVGNQQSALKTLSDQLAAAIAANDPVGNQALQSAIDGMAVTLQTETAKVGAALAAATPTPSPTSASAPVDPVATPPSTDTPTTGSSGSSGPQETGSSGSVGAPTADPHAPVDPPTTPPPTA